MHHVCHSQKVGPIATIHITAIHSAPIALLQALFPITKLQYPTTSLVEMTFRAVILPHRVRFEANCKHFWAAALNIILSAVSP